MGDLSIVKDWSEPSCILIYSESLAEFFDGWIEVNIGERGTDESSVFNSIPKLFINIHLELSLKYG